MTIDPSPLYPEFVPTLRKFEIEHLQGKIAPLLQRCMNAGSPETSRRAKKFNVTFMDQNIKALGLSAGDETKVRICINLFIDYAKKS